MEKSSFVLLKFFGKIRIVRRVLDLDTIIADKLLA